MITIPLSQLKKQEGTFLVLLLQPIVKEKEGSSIVISNPNKLD